MSSAAGPHLLIAGSGSVGRRHALNLHQLGCRISVADPREDRRDELSAQVPLIGSFATVEAALSEPGIDGIVIASPTAFHVEQAIAAVTRRLPVLLEKPLGMHLADGLRLAAAAQATRTPVLLGYTWRWWPALQRIKALLDAGAIGEVRHLRCTMSAHLADWHPWEPYQEFFMASDALGGGALLDESHWIDLAIWLLGKPTSVFADIDRLSDLEIDTDDNVDLLLTHASGARSLLHLDIHGRPHERSLTIAGSEGTIQWSDRPDTVRIGHGIDTWTEEPFGSERNDMFLALARTFLTLFEPEAGHSTEAPDQSCNIEDGLEVLRVIDGARISSREGVRTLVRPA